MNKKRIFAVLTALLFVFGLTACKRLPVAVKYDTVVNGSKVTSSHLEGEQVPVQPETSDVGDIPHDTTPDDRQTTENNKSDSESHKSSSKSDSSSTVTVSTDAEVSSSEGTGSNSVVQKGIIHTGKFEKPFTGNAATLFGGMHSPFDDTAEKLRQKILNTKDTLKAGKGHNTFYVSYRGDDSNSGFSEKAPFATLTAANRMTSSGDVILFERGGVYRGNLSLKSGVSLGAYGKGPKPCIYGSLQNYADPSLWESCGTNLWKISVPSEQGMIGSIIFDNGKNAADFITTIEEVQELGEDGTQQPSFCYKNHIVYLTCKDNPGKVYSSIEFLGNGHVLDVVGSSKNMTIENLCVKYGGEHGISFASGAQNIVIRGCEVGFIGGCLLGDTIRYGNAIQFWGNCKNITVENCWTYQCFDTGITNQYQSSDNFSIMRDITFNENLIEYTNYGLEYFNLGGVTVNQTFSNNMIRFSGYGLFPCTKRTGGKLATDAGTATMQIWTHRCTTLSNFKVTGNYFDTSARYLVVGTDLTGLDEDDRLAQINAGTYPLIGNHYCLQTVYPVQKLFNGIAAAPCVYGKSGSLNPNYTVLVTSLDLMKSEVTSIDPEAKQILFVTK